MRIAAALHDLRDARSTPWALSIGISLLSGLLWLVVGPLPLVAMLAAGGLALVALASHAWIVALVLAGRTALDLFWEDSFYVSGVRISAASFFSLVVLVLLLLTIAVRRQTLAISEGARALVLLLAGSLIGTVTAYGHFGDGAGMAAREIVRLLVLLVWYLFLYEWCRRTGDGLPFMRAVLVASVLPLLLGIGDVISGRGIETAGVIRISSTFVDPNAFGFYLVFIVIGCFAWFTSGGGFPAGLVLGISLFLLVFTYSRGAWISLAIAVPIFWLRVSRRRLVIAAIIVTATVVAYPLLSERLASVDYTEIVRESRTEVTSNSFSFRVIIWKRLLARWLEHPLFGWGLESTALINPIRSEWDGRGAAAHNDGVRYLVETGLVGAAFYLGFLIRLGRTALRRARVLAAHPLQYYALAGVVIYVAFLIQSLSVAEPLHQTIFSFHFFGLVAVVEGVADRAVAEGALPDPGGGPPTAADPGGRRGGHA